MYDTTPADAFQKLVKDLADILGPSSGLDSAEVNPQDLIELMEHYTSKEADWERYAWGDFSRAYTRNIVDKGNGKSNLLVLVWTPGKGSPIHDHANAHCVMKVLRGNLQETLYEWPEENARSSLTVEQPLHIKRERVYGENEVTYMADSLGLHRISNPDSEQVAVSLHLYTPPQAECHVFDPNTGKASKVRGINYSEYGRKIDPRSIPARQVAQHDTSKRDAMTCKV